MTFALESIFCPRCAGELLHEGSAAGLVVTCPSCGNPLQLPGEKAAEESFRDEALDLECAFHGQHPVQGEGRVRGHPFYFRAKWNFWYFTACTSHADLHIASCIDPTNDEGGFFQHGEYTGYMLTAYFGSGQDASTMSLRVAQAIVRDCAARLLEALEQRMGGPGG
jgi:hypothetical protein